MNLLERDPPQPKILERAVVAFGEPVVDVAVVWCTEGITRELAEGMYCSGDAFEHGSGAPHYNPDHGLWVWEGYIQCREIPTDYGYEFDVEYNGKWRELTDDEWAAVRKNKNPWPNESKSAGVPE